MAAGASAAVDRGAGREIRLLRRIDLMASYERFDRAGAIGRRGRHLRSDIVRDRPDIGLGRAPEFLADPRHRPDRAAVLGVPRSEIVKQALLGPRHRGGRVRIEGRGPPALRFAPVEMPAGLFRAEPVPRRMAPATMAKPLRQVPTANQRGVLSRCRYTFFMPDKGQIPHRTRGLRL